MKYWGNLHREVVQIDENKKPETSKPFEKQHGSYRAQLFDYRWREKRERVLQRDSSKCRFCQSTENLHVSNKLHNNILTLEIEVNLQFYS